MEKIRIAIPNKGALCQPAPLVMPAANGENRNWPNDPAAVPAPKESMRQRSGISLPNAPMTRLNEDPASPSPTRTPALRSSIPGDVEYAIRVSPSA